MAARRKAGCRFDGLAVRRAAGLRISLECDSLLVWVLIFTLRREGRARSRPLEGRAQMKAVTGRAHWKVAPGRAHWKVAPTGRSRPNESGDRSPHSKMSNSCSGLAEAPLPIGEINLRHFPPKGFRSKIGRNR